MEIEMKVPCGSASISDIVNKLATDKKYSIDEFVKKSDSFYTNISDEETKRRASKVGGMVVRLRANGTLKVCDAIKVLLSNKAFEPTIKGETYFTTKMKTMNGNYESNVENETTVGDASVMDASLRLMGYHLYFNKVKYSLGAFCKIGSSNYHIELERVMNEKNGKNVLYIEIENTDDGNSESQVIDGITKILEDFGLNASNADNRPWVKILE